MNHPTFQIRHGEFHNATGPPRRFGDFTFLPAQVTLHGSSFDFVHPLGTFVEEAPFATKVLVKPGEDAPWVLGRLMHLFGSQLAAEEERPEKSCFAECFVAVMHSRENLCIPFYCTDYYCKSALVFSSEDSPAVSIQLEIAEAFWGALLEAPADLTDYDSRLFHSGACIWIEFGVSNGEPYMFETEEL